MAEGSANGTVPFTVTLSEAESQAVTVKYRTLPGTALTGEDFRSLTGVLTFLPGETVKTIAVAQTVFRTDGVPESDESVVLELFDPVVGRMPTGAETLRATAWILDGDSFGAETRALFVSNPVVRERDGSTINAVFTVSISEPFLVDTLLDYRLVDGSATGGDDYEAGTGQIEFLAGQTEATVGVRIFGDETSETAENFYLVVTPNGGITSGGAGAVGQATVLDDDTRSSETPAISIEGTRTPEGSASGQVQFIVSLSDVAAQAVSVSYQALSGTATSGVDFNTTSGTLTFLPGEKSKIVTVTQRSFRADGVSELDETVVLQLTNPVNAELGGGQTAISAASWILDGDNLGEKRAVFVSSPVIKEPEGKDTAFAVFDVDISRPADVEMTLTYQVRASGSGAGSAEANSDFSTKSGTLVFAPGQTRASVAVEILADERLEPAESFLMRIVPPLPIQFVASASGLIGAGTIIDASIVGTIGPDTLLGSDRANALFGLGDDDTLFGLDGADRLDGSSGDDELYGGRGNDRLYGGVGDDVLDGGKSKDRMEGYRGDDRYVVDNRSDRVIEGEDEGRDLVQSSIDYKLGKNLEKLTLTGDDKIDGKGNGLDNLIRGNKVKNVLDGSSGDDRLYGGKGNDVLIGGKGQDDLYGGKGSDDFVFADISESGKGSRKRDVIHDFERGKDSIDLSGIDANENRGRDQDFDFIFKRDFSGKTGELRFEKELLMGDVDGDGRADFHILVDGVSKLGNGDFDL